MRDNVAKWRSQAGPHVVLKVVTVQAASTAQAARCRKSLEDCGHYLIRKVRSLFLRLSDSRRGFPAGKSVGGSNSPAGTPHKGHRPLQSHLPRALPMPDRRTGHDGVRGAKVVVDLDRCGSLVNNKDRASHVLPFAARIERAADERNHPIFRHPPGAETPARALM